MTMPDTTLIRPSQTLVMRDRKALTTTVRQTRQALERRKTPTASEAAPSTLQGSIQGLANSAANDRIVIGLVSVRPRIDSYAPASPPRTRREPAATVRRDRGRFGGFRPGRPPREP